MLGFEFSIQSSVFPMVLFAMEMLYIKNWISFIFSMGHASQCKIIEIQFYLCFKIPEDALGHDVPKNNVYQPYLTSG